ncbi:MAG: tandem-95 repeat protein [Planctomycetales bacterium]|nr:tandem-95 repeat protein [Planctomycetales bacterium]
MALSFRLRRSGKFTQGNRLANRGAKRRNRSRPWGLELLEARLVLSAAPQAVDDHYDLDEDRNFAIFPIGILENDIDADGDFLTAHLVSETSLGMLVFSIDGSFGYYPEPDYVGTDSFTYRAHDGSQYSNVATVTLNVRPMPDLPVAEDDAYEVDEDSSLTVDVAQGVLTNDSDVDGDVIESGAVQQDVAHGTLTFNADGSFEYTPDADFFGIDSFTYRATAAGDESNDATVTITVNPLPDAPVAIFDSYSTEEDLPFSIEVVESMLTNDGDVDGDSITAVLVDDVAHGELTLRADGTFDYAPDGDYFGDDSFTYQATDGALSSNVATVTIHVIDIPDRNDDDDYEPNDIQQDAYELPATSHGSLSAVAGLAMQGDRDWYRIDLPADTARFRVDLLPEPGEGTLQLQLVDAAGAVLDQVTADTLPTTLEAAIDSPGEHFLVVAGPHAGRLYDLVWQAVPANSIGGVLWSDLNGDRVRNLGEPPLVDWSVYLDENNNEQFDAGEPTTTTNDLGQYAFTGLAAGDYVVRQLPLAGWYQRSPPIEDSASLRYVTVPGEPRSDFSENISAGDGFYVVGAPGATNDIGAAYLVNADSGELSEAIRHRRMSLHDRFGNATAAFGNQFIVGKRQTSSSQDLHGVVTVYDVAKIDQPREISNRSTNKYNEFGWSLDHGDGYIVVGAAGEEIDGNGDAGTVYIYNSESLDFVHRIDNPVPENSNEFGRHVAAVGPYVFAWTEDGLLYQFDAFTGEQVHDYGAVQFDVASIADDERLVVVGNTSGRIQVIDSELSQEIYQYESPFPNDSDAYGAAVAIIGDRILVGAPGTDTNTSDTGAVHLVEIATGNVELTIGNPTPERGDEFGKSLAIYDGTVLIGANDESQLDNVLTGAVYSYRVFRADGGHHVTLAEGEAFANLDFGVQQADDSYEENDAREAAYDLEQMSDVPLSDIAGLAWQVDDDWYRIDLPGDTQRLRVDITPAAGDGELTLQLVDAAGAVVAEVAADSDPARIDELINVTGEYFLKISGANTGRLYDLVWQASPPMAISGVVWFDIDGNGVRDAGEPPVAAVDVALYEVDGVDGSEQFVASTVSGEDGSYSFDRLLHVTYRVHFTDPVDTDLTLPLVGDDRAADSDPDPATRLTDAFELAIGESLLTVDAGLIENHAPEAANDAFDATEGETLVIATPGVLINDSDADGDALTAQLVRDPLFGSVEMQADGGFTYTPNPDHFGFDSFTYVANDGDDDSNIATVSLNIAGVPDLPVAEDDAYDVDEDATLAVDFLAGILANDRDADGETLSPTIVQDVSHGALTLNANGSFEYTPNADYFGVDSFTYRAVAGGDESNLTTVTITVNPLPDNPTAVDDVYTVDEDSLLLVGRDGIGQPVGWDFDEGVFNSTKIGHFGGVELNRSVGSGYLNGFSTGARMEQQLQSGTIAGVFDTTTDWALVGFIMWLDFEDDLPAEIVVYHRDQSTNDFEKVYSEAVLLEYQGRTYYEVPVEYNFRPGESYAVGIAWNDHDVTFRTAESAATDASRIEADGGVMSDLVAPAMLNWDDDPGPHLDAGVRLASHTDYAPVGSYTSSLIRPVADLAWGTLNLDILRPEGTSLMVDVLPAEGDVPFEGFSGIDESVDLAGLPREAIRLRAHLETTDRFATPALRSWSIQWDELLGAPIEGILANDFDVDGDSVEFGGFGRLTQHGQSWFFEDGTFIYSPDAEFYGTDSFTYWISDGVLGSNTATVTIQVANVPDDPKAVIEGDDIIGEGDTLQLDASASFDSDGEALTFAWDLNDDGDFSDAEGPTPVVDWETLRSLGVDDNGAYPVHVRVEDESGAFDVASVLLTVNNRPPLLSTVGDGTVVAAQSYSLQLVASDPGDDAIVSWTVDWGDETSDDYDGDTSVAEHVYAGGVGAVYDVTVAVQDDDGSYNVSHQVRITSNPPEPVDDEVSTPEDVPIPIDALANDADPDGDAFTFDELTQPAHGVATIVREEISAPLNPTGAAIPSLVLAEVSAGGFIELYNTTADPIDLGAAAHWLVTPTASISLASVAAGMTIAPNAYVAVDWPAEITETAAQGEIALYRDSDTGFGDASKIDDFLIWGGIQANTRFVLAQSFGRWAGAPLAPGDATTIHRLPDTDGAGAASYEANSEPTPDQAIAGAIELVETIRYTPNRDFFGTDAFTYTVIDVHGDVGTATVQVTVEPVNDAPVPHGDDYKVVRDVQLSVDAIDGVLTNDVDVDSPALVAELVADVAHGELTFSPDGTFVYVPDTGYLGPDFFTYTVSDEEFTSAETRVDLEVFPPASINGTLWSDIDGDGEYEPLAGETPLAGWTVYLDLNEDGAFDADREPSRVTNGEGAYTFSNLPPGIHAVRAETRVNWEITSLSITEGGMVPVAVPADQAGSYDRFEHIYDKSREILYVLAPGGEVVRYDVARQQYLPSIEVGVELSGIDISPDYRYLYVGQEFTAGGNLVVSKIDLETGDIRNLTTPVASSISGVLDLSLAYHGDGFVTVHGPSLGIGQPVFRIWGTRNELEETTRSVRTPSVIYRGQDRSLLVFTQMGNDDYVVYDPTRGEFRTHDTSMSAGYAYLSSIAVSPGGQYLAHERGGGIRYYHRWFEYRGDSGGERGGIAFDTQQPVLYNLPDGGESLVRYSSSTFELLEVADTGAQVVELEPFQHYFLSVASEGDQLFVSTPGGAYVLHLDRIFTPPGTHVIELAAGEDRSGIDFGLQRGPGNEPTVAADDDYGVPAGTRLTVDAADGVLKNDTDPEGDSLSAQVVSPPSHGVLTLRNDGSFEYVPQVGFVGLDTFAYAADDDRDVSAAATVTINVYTLADRLLTVNDAFGASGSRATASLSIDEAAGLEAFDVSIAYDTQWINITADDIRLAEHVAAWSIVPVVDDVLGRIDISMFGTRPLTPGPSDLLHFDFVVKADAPEGATAAIEVASSSLNEGQILGAAVDGTLTVIGATLRAEVITADTAAVTIGFTRPFDPQPINLYRSQQGGNQVADVTLSGANGLVPGSLAWSEAADWLVFVPLHGMLPPDNYTLRLRSASDGFAAPDGELLDGDANGTPGGDFVLPFQVGPSSEPRLEVRSFVRGAGQVVQLNGTAGIPVGLDEAEGILAATLVVHYDPTLLEITGATPASSLPPTWQVESFDATTPGEARIRLTGSEALGGGPADLLVLGANVPATARPGGAHAIMIDAIEINDGALPDAGGVGFHSVGFFGDASGNGDFSALDAALIARVAVGLDEGFAAYGAVSPMTVADVTGDGTVSSLDASYVARKALGLPQPEIPELPSPTSLPAPPATSTSNSFDPAEVGPLLTAWELSTDVATAMEEQGSDESAEYDAIDASFARELLWTPSAIDPSGFPASPDESGENSETSVEQLDELIASNFLESLSKQIDQ